MDGLPKIAESQRLWRMNSIHAIRDYLCLDLSQAEDPQHYQSMLDKRAELKFLIEKENAVRARATRLYKTPFPALKSG